MKIALIAFNHEVSFATAAVKSIHEESGETIEILALTPEKFKCQASRMNFSNLPGTPQSSSCI